jgi:hypothetical protein
MVRLEHSFLRSRGEALAAGSGQLGAAGRGLAAGGGALVHAAAMAGMMVGANVLTSALRQALFAPDQMQKHADDGTLGEYILDLAMQRSGLNGTLDPIIQMFTNLRYNSDIASLLGGASLSWFAKNAQDLIQPFVTTNDSPNSNTRYWNQGRAAFNLIGVPAAVVGLTALGSIGGPLTRLTAGAALQAGTSPFAASLFANTVAGPKGVEPEKTTQGLKGLEDLSGLKNLPKLGAEAKPEAAGDAGGGGLAGGWGLADDIAVPLWRYGGPVLNRLPGVIKLGTGAVVAAGGIATYLSKTAPFRGQPAPEPKHN